MELPDGIVAVVKRDCPTCTLVIPVLHEIAARTPLTVYTQDDPAFPDGLPVVIDDTDLQVSAELDLTTVPTLLRVEGGRESGRAEGWLRSRWEELTGLAGLGAGLPEHRPGCGSLTADPSWADRLAARSAEAVLRSRRLLLGAAEDDAEASFERGWTDGLPVVAPTPARVVRMLAGTTRDPQEVVATVPPDLLEATVEKVAVNAVLAGCRPEYLPVVLAAVQAACTDEFNMHGLVATTYFAGPVVVVSGPVAERIGMSSGVNALGQGNRANATIGRALNLVVRNIGGGRPGEVDRATLGNPGKYTFCFAEAEPGARAGWSAPWPSLAQHRGVAPGRSAVTLFAGAGVVPVVDQRSRDPGSLARTFAACLRTVPHPKQVLAWDAMLVVSPEHLRVFAEAGWSRERLLAELDELLLVSPGDLVAGAHGMAEGLPPGALRGPLPKFRPGGLLVVQAGGGAGMFSAIVPGWVSGPAGSQPVTREIGG